MLHIAWTIDGHATGEATIAQGATFILARRMNLPPQQAVVAETIDGSSYVFVRLPHVSDPALVVTATASHPVVHRGQRDNGAIVEVTTPTGGSTTPAPGQKLSLTDSGSRIELRFPDLAFAATVTFTLPDLPDGSGTVQLGVDSLQHDDTWLIGAIAVALSPDGGVVAHGDLKRAFALWRGTDEHSDGAFDRNVLRPALAARGLEAGPRMNKIVLLVERCRRTAEFPSRVLDDVRDRLTALDGDA
ncbi:hypothetical protein [Aeromicrobium fastidiosum]|uniref:Uncharacterized protein n=1 Tax=Aeromicrobium fastidiosum TaxID=52699 RepID=A0A641AK39_9ACTN|nr:hypothetical protein [Aeromicrobium fastidiosum]KAA1376046.1 hypothetical protein ESP62_011365 [Aeromicrobium fastidiosum]MBP2392083.1 hypothetical protein [Aeromicrobium fastidiosum]